MGKIKFFEEKFTLKKDLEKYWKEHYSKKNLT